METLLIDKFEAVAGEILQRKEAILAKYDLAIDQDKFLFALLVENGINMGSLAKTINVRPPSAAKFATKLEQLELIKREASRLDSRQQHAFLTQKGREIAEELQEKYTKLDRKIHAALKQKQKDRLVKLLDLIDPNSDAKKPAAKKPKKAGKSIKELKKSKENKKK